MCNVFERIINIRSICHDLTWLRYYLNKLAWWGAVCYSILKCNIYVNVGLWIVTFGLTNVTNRRANGFAPLVSVVVMKIILCYASQLFGVRDSYAIVTDGRSYCLFSPFLFVEKRKDIPQRFRCFQISYRGEMVHHHFFDRKVTATNR